MRARLATEADFPTLLRLGRLMTGIHTPHLSFDDERGLVTLHRYLEAGNPVFWVAEADDGRVVGMLQAIVVEYGFVSGFFVTQEVIFVEPSMRGSRAAAALIQIFNDWADRVDCNEVFMGIANGFQPETTAALFERYGFEKVGSYLRRIRR